MAYPPGTMPTTREDVDTTMVYRQGSPVLRPRQWFNRLEACAYLGISPRTLLRLRKEGKLTGYSPEAGYGSDPAGGKLRYRRADLDALLELKPAPHPDAPSEPDQDPIPGLEVVGDRGSEPTTVDLLEALQASVDRARAGQPKEHVEGDRDRTGFKPGEKEALFGELERSYARKRHVVVFGTADFCPICSDGGGQTHEHRSDDVAAALGAWTGDPVQDTADLAYNRES